MVHIGIVMTANSRGDSQDESVAQWIEQELYSVHSDGGGDRRACDDKLVALSPSAIAVPRFQAETAHFFPQHFLFVT